MKPDAFSYHEVVDRTSVIIETLDNALGNHPVVTRHPELKKALQQTVDSLYAMYTLAARISSEEYP